MKTLINAYLYPTPEEFDRQMAQYWRDLTRVFNPSDHVSSDDHDGLIEINLGQIEQRVLDYLTRRGIANPSRFIPNAPDEFVWQSHDGERYNITDMATPHLFYSLRMIFNHTVPPIFRVLRPGEAMRRYNDVVYWTEDYRRRAVDALVAELKQRDDLDEELQDQFNDMQANTRTILALGL